MLRLTDLREILRYVPHFRDRVFVIAMDGAIVADENCNNILLDVALLRSLRIGVVLVHGASLQIRELAQQIGAQITNSDGIGVTDATTLQVSLTAANRVTHEILEGLARADLRGAYSNAIVAHPAGILQGIDHQLTGKVERVDVTLLTALLHNDILPVVSPVGCDGEGKTYRLNSDAVAVEVARALKAVKLIFLTDGPGVIRNGELLRQLTIDEAETILRKSRDELASESVSKLEHAVRAAREGVPRVHVIDGRVEEGLLAEVFSNEGIGTLLHTNEYRSIRRAVRRDSRVIHRLIQAGVATDELVRRSRSDIERQIDDYFVFEVDRNPVACVALHVYPQQRKAELACLYVDRRYENQGIGGRLVHYVEDQARLMGLDEIFCLSTQTFNFFQQKGGFKPGTPDDLPPTRRDLYERSNRRSLVLVKKLN